MNILSLLNIYLMMMMM